MSDKLFQHAVREWLEDGSDRTPRPSIDAVLLAVKTTPQERDLRVPRRFTPMPTYLRLAAGIAIVAVVGAGALTVLNSGSSPGNSAPTTTATPSPAQGPVLGEYQGLMVGALHDSGVFGEPFTFVMPPVDGTGSNRGLPEQFSDGGGTHVSPGLLVLGGPWWSMRFVDDMPINVDLCDPTSTILPDIPATPEAVGAWLEAERPMRLRSWRVLAAEPVPVDGRTALRWDLAESEEDLGCHLRLPANQPRWGEMLLRVYAIPTGDDTILLIGGSDMVNFEAVSAVMDGIVRTMQFK